MIPNKFSGLSIFLILALLISSFAAVMPAAPVKAAAEATGITINSPTTIIPIVVQPGGSITCSYTLDGAGGDSNDVQLEIYQGTTSISLVTDSGKASGATYTKTMGISSAAAQGGYTLKASVVGLGFYDSEASAVIVDSTPPTVTISTPNINTCWKSGTTQYIQWSVSDAASTDNVTLKLEYSVNGGGSWLELFNRSNRQGADQYQWTVVDASQPASYVRFTATDSAGNVMTSPQQSSPFKILNTSPTVSMVTPGNTVSETYSAGTLGTATGRITALITGLPSSTIQYQIGMFVNGVNTDNITSGWQTATLNASGQYLLSSISGGGYLWRIENNIANSNCRIGIWAKDCAGNVNDPTVGGSTAMSAYPFRIQDQQKPTGTVVSPTAASSVHYVGSSDNVIWTMTDYVAWPTLSYQIWLSYNSGSTYTELISSGNAAQGTNTIPWSPVTPTTTGKIKIDITDGETPANTNSIYSGPFSIVQGSQPVVTSVTVPAAAVEWPIGSTQNVTFAASDPSNTSARLNYQIDLAADGVNFYNILTPSNETQGTKTYSVSVPDVAQSPYSVAVPANSAKIRVTATNPLSGSGGGSATGSTFSITAASFPVTTETVSLKTGWNLVSLPLIPTNSNIQNILGSAMSNIESVWTCSGGGSTGGTWSYFVPGSTSGLSTMVDGKTYWIKATADTSFTFQGRKGNAPPSAPPTYTFSSPGWYMVGYKSTQTHTVTQYAGSNQSGSTTIYTLPITGFDPITQAYKPLYGSDNMTKGEGYWFYYNSAGAIAPPSD